MIKPFYARQYRSCLILPVIDLAKKIWGLQYIAANGQKWFFTNTAKQGNFTPIHSKLTEKSKKNLICESFATGASLAECYPDVCVVAACDANNLKPVAVNIRQYIPQAELIICADDDQLNPDNPGINKGKEAAVAANASFIKPQWPLGAPEKLTDFNDLFCWLSSDSWVAEREGLLIAIKNAKKGGKETSGLQQALWDHQSIEPQPPRIPKLLLGDETPESLAWKLAKQWPSSGIVSNEAGLIFGAHSMGKDSVMRNLALLNVLWDGGNHSVGRKTSESFTVQGARLTMALQVQEGTLRSFFEKSGSLARDTGFLARFLIAWPESTQGKRFFTEAPINWPHLDELHKRITQILDMPVQINTEGGLIPNIMSFTPSAKAAWVEFHDQIESELVSSGELYDKCYSH
jgi:hypothetical protein